MEEKEYRLNPMLPRRFNSRQRAEIKQKEKEIIEDSRNEYFLDHTSQGKKIKEMVLRRGEKNEI